MRTEISQLIRSIVPFDELEKTQIQDTLNWIDSMAEIFRLEKPATPPKHLVSYFVLLDLENRQILLADHRKAHLWLPSGGHVEPGEHPRVTVEREIEEELKCKAEFIQETPFFLTVTSVSALENQDPSLHVDVSLWYLLQGNIHQTYDFDQTEFHSIKWFDFNKIPYTRTHPQMKQFMKKLETVCFKK
ncbi:MAG: NUDIX hydrolase [Alphaproteobacteria bacterium]|nr:NUDIX hydrolase [Alphaproteobacteria bacterium]